MNKIVVQHYHRLMILIDGRIPDLHCRLPGYWLEDVAHDYIHWRFVYVTALSFDNQKHGCDTNFTDHCIKEWFCVRKPC